MDADIYTVTATLDRIIFGDERTFPADDARLLRRVIPRQRRPFFGLTLRGIFPKGSTRGYASGIGNVEMETERKTRTVEVGGDRFVRCGQYKLLHERATLEIWPVLSQEVDEDAKAAQLVFAGDEPVVLRCRTPKGITIPVPPFISLTLARVAWTDWKRPV